MVLLLRYIIIKELTCPAKILAHAHTAIDTVLLNLEAEDINARKK